MKKILFLSVLFCLICSGRVFAHPPSQINLSVNGKTLIVNVIHKVGSPVSHYIKQITVTLNGQEIIVQHFLMQTHKDHTTVSYTIPSLRQGDVVEVEAACNVAGKGDAKITAE